MRCPVCRTPTDRMATRCVCGHEFQGVEATAPAIAGAGGAGAAVAPVADAVPARPVRKRVPQRRETHPITFSGEGGALFGLHLINLCKTSLTLGLYHFWAKVSIRKYLYAHTAFHGDPFGYHGTGRELLIGWSKIAGIFLAIIGFTTYLELVEKVLWAGVIGQVLFFAVSLVLLPMAIIGSNRYRLSRTSWRGIRFSFRGRVKAFWPIAAKGIVFSALTLGLYQPYFQVNARRYIAEHSYFGDQAFGFDGEAGPLVGPYVLMLLLLAPTLGLAWFWYRARRDRHLWNHTTFGKARFQCTISGFELAKLMAGNMLLSMVSFGLAKPWVETRKLRYLCANLVLTGPLDVERIHQQAQAAEAAGEGLTDFMEMGLLDIEVGL